VGALVPVTHIAGKTRRALMYGGPMEEERHTLRRACIDIGANTTRLLVADCDPVAGQLDICHQERVLNRLGAATGADGELPGEKVAELVEIVRSQRLSALKLGAEEIACVGTAGLRRARNRDTIGARIAGACGGLQLKVLDGASEARYAFTGAAWAIGLARSAEPLAVVDVGGGSTELVVGVPATGVTWWRSVSVGSADGPGLGLRGDPPDPRELDWARRRAVSEIGAVPAPPAVAATAVGGSAGTLHQIIPGELDSESLLVALAQVTARPAGQTAVALGLELERVRMLPAGLLLLLAASELFARPLQIGFGGLREGLLLLGV